VERAVRAAIAGCGTIANILHLPGLAAMAAAGTVELVAACDVAETAARAAADRFGIPVAYSDLAAMLAGEDFDLLVNATPIPDHLPVTLAALRAGRHVYTQKPMAATVDEATLLIEEAKARGLLLAAAPEHPVRPAIRAVKALLDEGAIGPVAFAVVRSSHGGPETHDVPRDSTWFYQPGSSPLLDMGVHGLSQITALLGPVRRVASLSGRTAPVRVHTAGPFTGKPIDVRIDDSTLLLLDFGEATFGFLDATYRVPASRGPHLEIYGADGVISVSRHGQQVTVEVYRSETKEWREVAMPADPPVRDLGVLHTVACLRGEETLILTGERGRHLVDIMVTAPKAAASGATLDLTTEF
jgi:predicted dehydrogenase